MEEEGIWEMYLPLSDSEYKELIAGLGYTTGLGLATVDEYLEQLILDLVREQAGIGRRIISNPETEDRPD